MTFSRPRPLGIRHHNCCNRPVVSGRRAAATKMGPYTRTDQRLYYEGTKQICRLFPKPASSLTQTGEEWTDRLMVPEDASSGSGSVPLRIQMRSRGKSEKPVLAIQFISPARVCLVLEGSWNLFFMS
jgi:hypothetical protein